MTGYVQVYTGNGKGKTTAAIGLAVRAAGAGMQIYIGQFIKMGNYSEIQALKRFSDRITVEQFGRGRFMDESPEPEDIESARRGLARISRAIDSGRYDMVVLDEANVAVKYGLIEVATLEKLIGEKPPEVELVITGREAHERIVAAADLVTEMRAVKHYYAKGVESRVGIEK